MPYLIRKFDPVLRLNRDWDNTLYTCLLLSKVVFCGDRHIPKARTQNFYNTSFDMLRGDNDTYEGAKSFICLEGAGLIGVFVLTHNGDLSHIPSTICSNLLLLCLLSQTTYKDLKPSLVTQSLEVMAAGCHH